MAVEVRNNEARSRYELTDEGTVVGVADYSVRGDTIVFPHTEIDPRHRGKGFGAILVQGALDDVRASTPELRIVPACWYVAQFIDEHPEYRDLVAA